jgi:hypothetical protein
MNKEFLLEQEIGVSVRQDSGSLTSSAVAIGPFCDARHFKWQGTRSATDIQFVSHLKPRFDIHVRALSAVHK